MKVVIINGVNHKGSTYHIARQIAEKTNGEITEFFLPRDFDEFCLSCNQCFMKSEKSCKAYSKLEPITKAMIEADVIILASPVYVYHASGAMKSFLDHFGYMWMVHRPNETMFKKQGVVVSTAAGAGMKSTNKDMADSLFFWGVAKIYKLGFAVRAVNWNQVVEKRKAKLDKKTSKIAKKLVKRNGKVKVGFKTKGFFYIMRIIKKNGWNDADVNYWKERGWDKKNRPWKNKQKGE